MEEIEKLIKHNYYSEFNKIEIEGATYKLLNTEELKNVGELYYVLLKFDKIGSFIVEHTSGLPFFNYKDLTSVLYIGEDFNDINEIMEKGIFMYVRSQKIKRINKKMEKNHIF